MLQAFQLIPVRGRKPRSLILGVNLCRFQLIPARGRKRDVLGAVSNTANFNFSPQGDGNCHRGCKQRRSCCISTYPRKGTETALPLPGRRKTEYFNLSPQGDGNLFNLANSVAFLTFQLIPARGQKTPHQKRCGVFLLQTLTLYFPWAFSL